jgi:hypothetical protein
VAGDIAEPTRHDIGGVMSRPCPAHRAPPTPVGDAGEQQVNLTVMVEAHPLVEVAAAEMMLSALEVMRAGGIVVHHVQRHIDGGDTQGWR